jgi:hypothetical protein
MDEGFGLAKVLLLALSRVSGQSRPVISLALFTPFLYGVVTSAPAEVIEIRNDRLLAKCTQQPRCVQLNPFRVTF